MDFLTEEEEFELMHQDEMEAMEEVEYPDFVMPQFSTKSLEKSLVNTTEPQLDVSPESCTSPDIGNENDEHAVPLTNNEAKDAVIENLFGLEAIEKQSNEGIEKTKNAPVPQNETPVPLTRNKRPLSENSDDSDEVNPFDPSNKKHCASLENHCSSSSDNAVASRGQANARKSLSFGSKHNFSTEQQPLTRSDGRRIYFSVHDEEGDEESSFNVRGFSQRTNSLLPMPIDVLKSQLCILREVQLLKQTQNTVAVANTEPTVDIYEDTEVENALWVEKYRPLSYMHLLSEEGINRTLLQWLKLWDKVVFNKEKKSQKKKVPPAVPPTKFQRTFGELIDEPDEHGRPFHKVAFLCGPPGLGKTTLAVIIAKHVGYNVVEMNASDDRNPDAFRSSLEAATQMKSVLHEDRRPNCLILDEIDGAPVQSINLLLQFIKSTGTAKGKRKKGDIPLLTRPVICICNDQYSAALKPLRQVALVLNFPPTAGTRLTSRLNEVAIKEGLHADMAALTLLCEKASNDIRSCLSTLQFIHRQKKQLMLSDVSGLKIGQKDMHKSLFAVWQDIFHVKGNKSFSGISNTVQAFGDYEKIYVGIFENYVNVKFKGRNSESLWQGSEWMCFGDIIQQQIARSQLYILMPYLPYPAVAFHFLYASPMYAHVTYPSAFYECRSKATQLSNVLTSVMKEIASSLKTFLNPCTVIEDILPFLVEIIKPSLRPVNAHLYSEREKNELQRVIELMLSFNFNYRQERQQNGTYAYVLDPNVEELIRFSEIKPKRELNYAAKQLIAREVEVERMRKGDATEELKEKDKALSKNKTVEKASNDKEPCPKPKEKKIPAVEKPTYDFFGRKIDVPVSEKNKGIDPNDEAIWFHFKEGYSNAVRRTIFIKDLI